ncbi:uncharacterized protein LOC114532947 [Dendronephthya gigantea]|uniref:uncharacterized protein LOC114532947 n=1 Tax=Dendronephthya gigantea TaxID=151771 RepID=UPI00106CC7B2|nr:uncharacterized protein LOC114532947 [Dendronephthya gigantea]
MSSPSGNDFTQAEICRIAKCIPRNWKEIAGYTGKFKKFEIENIEINNVSFRDDVDKAIRMLNDYVNRLGSRECLVSAMREAQAIDIAAKVESKYYQTHKLDDTKVFHDKKIENLATKLEKTDLKDGPSPNSEGGLEEAPTVFISYKRQSQEKVKKLKENLEKGGIKCWMDQDIIVGGDKVNKKLSEGIEACKVMVSCITEEYRKSPYCQKEAALADSLKKPIIPLLFDSVKWPLPGEMSMSIGADRAYIRCHEDLTDEILEEIIKAIDEQTKNAS